MVSRSQAEETTGKLAVLKFGSGAWSPFLAVFAGAENLQHVRSRVEAVFRFNCLFQIFDNTLIQVYAGPADIANQVVVVLSRLNDFVSSFAITQINCLHHS
jgi:hypothetical protein